MDAQRDASVPAGCEGWLRGEAESWVKERLIRSEQAQMILARYGLAEAETPGSLKQVPVIRLLTALGAILVGVGVLLVIGANWDVIPRVVRLALLLVVTGATYHSGYQMAYVRRNYPGVGLALLFLGSLLWGASIFLIGQMYHLSGEAGGGGEIRGVLYWFLGVLPLAYVLRSPLHLGLSIALGSIWLFVKWIELAHQNFEPVQVAQMAMAEGLFLYALGLLHRRRQSFEGLSATYTALGTAVVTATMYAFSFQYIWPEQGRYYGNEFHATVLSVWLWPALLLAAAVAGMLWNLARPRGERGFIEGAAVMGLALLNGLLLALLVVSGVSLEAGWSLGLMILFNVLLLGMEIGFVWLGWNRGEPGLVNFGLAVFSVHLFTRYCDLFVRMLPTGTAFIGAGVLLLVGGVLLERQRRRLMLTMPGHATA